MNSLRRFPIHIGVFPNTRPNKPALGLVCRGASALCLAILMVLIASGCNQSLFKNDLEAIQARGVLKVITRNNGTCYYEGPHGEEGFEYDLVKAFADYLNVRLEILVMENDKTMVTSLLNGDADLIAAGFIVSDDLRR
ncbi:MAG: transporter substrate-binding domain-containing protein, partial [Desulfobacterales bacterium]